MTCQFTHHVNTALVFWRRFVGFGNYNPDDVRRYVGSSFQSKTWDGASWHNRQSGKCRNHFLGGNFVVFHQGLIWFLSVRCWKFIIYIYIPALSTCIYRVVLLSLLLTNSSWLFGLLHRCSTQTPQRSLLCPVRACFHRLNSLGKLLFSQFCVWHSWCKNVTSAGITGHRFRCRTSSMLVTAPPCLRPAAKVQADT